MSKKIEPKVTIRGSKVTITFELPPVKAASAPKWKFKLAGPRNKEPRYKTPLGKFNSLQEAAVAHDVHLTTIKNRIDIKVAGYSKIERKAPKLAKRPEGALR